MVDIYGSQTDVLIQNGLADAKDEGDFNAKLCSLTNSWERKDPGFYDWFQKNRAPKTKECLGIETRFYTSGLELKRKLQKKRPSEANVSKEVSVVTKERKTWSEEFYVEEIRALRRIGKYRLAPGYESFFFVSPVVWNRWSPEQQSQHLKKLIFRKFFSQ